MSEGDTCPVGHMAKGDKCPRETYGQGGHMSGGHFSGRLISSGTNVQGDTSHITLGQGRFGLRALDINL